MCPSPQCVAIFDRLMDLQLCLSRIQNAEIVFISKDSPASFPFCTGRGDGHLYTSFHGLTTCKIKCRHQLIGLYGEIVVSADLDKTGYADRQHNDHHSQCDHQFNEGKSCCFFHHAYLISTFERDHGVKMIDCLFFPISGIQPGVNLS